MWNSIIKRNIKIFIFKRNTPQLAARVRRRRFTYTKTNY